MAILIRKSYTSAAWREQDYRSVLTDGLPEAVV